MKTYTKAELAKVLELHAMWRRNETGGERANLDGANLNRANLNRANLNRANLYGATLYRATLYGANLPAPTTVLLAIWGRLSDKLTRDLMRYDAANHPMPERFDAWVSGGKCPYDGLKIGRVANFTERKELWQPHSKARVKSAFELMTLVIREKCADSDYHTDADRKRHAKKAG